MAMEKDFRFQFEDALPHKCVPMVVRRRLDEDAQIHLPLKVWAASFSEEDREEILHFPAGSDFQEAYRERVRNLAFERSGEFPRDLAIADRFPWEEENPPQYLVERAAAVGASLDSWNDLDALSRFALVKLSRPRKNRSAPNKAFVPACREFGLLA